MHNTNKNFIKSFRISFECYSILLVLCWHRNMLNILSISQKDGTKEYFLIRKLMFDGFMDCRMFIFSLKWLETKLRGLIDCARLPSTGHMLTSHPRSGEFRCLFNYSSGVIWWRHNAQEEANTCPTPWRVIIIHIFKVCFVFLSSHSEQTRSIHVPITGRLLGGCASIKSLITIMCTFVRARGSTRTPWIPHNHRYDV